jgi:hypothetical protein
VILFSVGLIIDPAENDEVFQKTNSHKEAEISFYLILKLNVVGLHLIA